MRLKKAASRVVSDLPVKIICLTAAVILLLFHRMNTLTERFISVPLRVSVPSGFAIAASYPKSVRVTLRGEEESIFPILEEDLEASVSLEGHKSAGVFRAQVKVAKKGTALGVEPLEVKVEPQEIVFTLERKAEKTVSLIPDIKGSPAYGYELIQYSLSPQTVSIRGPQTVIQGIRALSTEEIDLTGRAGSFVQKVKVNLPNTLISLAGESSVEFRGTLQEALVSRQWDHVEIVCVDLPPGFRLKEALPTGSVKVQGSQLAVEGLKPEQVRLILDCSAVRRAGLQTMRPNPEVPDNITVSDFSPKELGVEFVVPGR
jgi:hypothetical protein